MKEKLARFMVGRNGNDQLNHFLLGLALALLVIAAIFKDSFGRTLRVNDNPLVVTGEGRTEMESGNIGVQIVEN